MTWYMHNSGQVTQTRISCGDIPVVVIDPEDRAQIERYEELRNAAFKIIHDQQGGGGVQHVDMAQMALRQMVDPSYRPRPVEPTGLGAVVQDTNGDRWLRFESSGSRPWMYASVGRVGEDRRYSDIAVVKVLNYGVTE